MHDTVAAKIDTSLFFPEPADYLEFGHLHITQLSLTTAMVSQRLYLSIKGVYAK